MHCARVACVLFALSTYAIADLENHYTFDDSADVTADASGNGRDGFIDDTEVIWVNDETRGGALQFGGSTNGFVLAEVPALEQFTIMTWAYRDPDLCCGSGGANDGLFQVQLGTDDLESLPAPSTSTKVIGGWVQKSDAALWGRVINAAGNNSLDRPFMMQDEVWTHLAYRSDGATFDVVVNGTAGVGPSLQYEGDSILEHDTVYIGRQGTETWGGRLDDFRVYSRALSDEEIMVAMIGVAPEDAGDFNDDGAVNLDDFNIMLSNFNQRFSTTESFSKGDNNVNGRVDLADFLEFRQLFNAQGAAAASVPEPMGITLFMTGLVTALFAAARQRRRRR